MRVNVRVVRGLAASMVALVTAPVALAQGPWVISGANVYYNAGNVGIGTAGPAYKLHVVNPSAVNGSRAVHGHSTAATGVTNGVAGQSNSNAGRGVNGFASATSGTTYGVLGQSMSPNGRGVYGLASSTTGPSVGVFGQSNSPGGWAGYFQGRSHFSGLVGIGTTSPIYRLHVVDPVLAVAGVATSVSGLANGVQGWTSSPIGFGVIGYSNALTGLAVGVGGTTGSPAGSGVYGSATNFFGTNYGVLGASSSLISGWAVYGSGDLGASGFKLFNIDHPLDPANRYLNHYCAEGPEPLLIYRGNIMLDETGCAWIELPAYFEAMNRDFHYHLTAIGAPAPLLHVAEEVRDNRFKVAGGVPGVKVSWTVTGVRNDAYARAYGKPVEQEKAAEHKGKYLHPQLFGQAADQGIHFRPSQVTAEPLITSEQD